MSHAAAWEALSTEERQRIIREGNEQKAIWLERDKAQERAANARDDRLRRQLAAVIDSDLLVARLMDACHGDQMTQSKVVETLLKSGLILVGQDPTSYTQP